MSLTSLAAGEIGRLETPLLEQRSIRNLLHPAVLLAPKHSIPVQNIESFLTETLEKAAPSEKKAAEASNALQSLVKYVPTESATLYLASASAAGALKATLPFFTPMFAYWFFALLTPMLFLLIYAGKRRAQELRPLPPLAQWPWWKLVASFVAFLAWGLAVPTNPFSTSPLRGAAFAFFAVFVSTLLSLVEGVIEPAAK